MSKKVNEEQKGKRKQNGVEEVVFDELEAEKAAGVGQEDAGQDDIRQEDAGQEDAGLMEDDRGMGTVEVILIIVVLIGLVIIFRNQITDIVNALFGKITAQTGGI